MIYIDAISDHKHTKSILEDLEDLKTHEGMFFSWFSHLFFLFFFSLGKHEQDDLLSLMDSTSD